MEVRAASSTSRAALISQELFISLAHIPNRYIFTKSQCVRLQYAYERPVSWKYGSGRPGGTVAEVVEEGQASVTSKKGNEIHRNAEPDNPAVKISRSGNDVVKKASELDIEDKGDNAGEEETVAEDDKKDDEEKAEENGDAQTGEKRKADDEAEDDKAEEAPKGAAKGKKQKTAKAAKATNGEKAAPKPKGMCTDFYDTPSSFSGCCQDQTTVGVQQWLTTDGELVQTSSRAFAVLYSILDSTPEDVRNLQRNANVKL